MPLCREERCRLAPAKYDRAGKMIKRNCYNERDERCPIAILDGGIWAIGTMLEMARAKRTNDNENGGV